MKKLYISPVCKVVETNVKQHLLIGSELGIGGTSADNTIYAKDIEGYTDSEDFGLGNIGVEDLGFEQDWDFEW